MAAYQKWLSSMELVSYPCMLIFPPLAVPIAGFLGLVAEVMEGNVRYGRKQLWHVRPNENYRKAY
jgi:hypothetical protein